MKNIFKMIGINKGSNYEIEIAN